uniref:Uncharacterized protein n=1 Tax=Arundo donax TaxID=35708 RepID=A0A0A9EM14_ARUDO
MFTHCETYGNVLLIRFKLNSLEVNVENFLMLAVTKHFPNTILSARQVYALHPHGYSEHVEETSTMFHGI